jgi:hypothetical protein
VALIVEDGTGKADAESFISVADATAYHANRGNAAWAALASDTVREQLLRKASEYMEQAYRLRWLGYRTTNDQALSWPRSEVPIPDAPGVFAGYYSYVDEYSVPVPVARACAEFALKAATATLYADESQKIVREKIGPMETEYAEFGTQTIQYRAIDALLAPYLSGGNGELSVVRM